MDLIELWNVFFSLGKKMSAACIIWNLILKGGKLLFVLLKERFAINYEGGDECRGCLVVGAFGNFLGGQNLWLKRQIQSQDTSTVYHFL